MATSPSDVLADLERVLGETPEDAFVVRPLPRRMVAAAADEIRKLRRYNAAAAERIARLHRSTDSTQEPTEGAA